MMKENHCFVVFVYRAGYVLVHLGCIPTEDTNVILMDNLLNIIVSVAANIFIGLTLFIGPHSFKGIFGYGWTICSKDSDHLQIVTSKCFCLFSDSHQELPFIRYYFFCDCFSCCNNPTYWTLAEFCFNYCYNCVLWYLPTSVFTLDAA